MGKVLASVTKSDHNFFANLTRTVPIPKGKPSCRKMTKHQRALSA